MGPLQCAPGPPPTAFSQDPPRIRSRERTSLVRNRMRAICTSGSVRGEGGNILTYSATEVALKYLFPLLVPGGIVILDEYGNKGWGESDAVDNFFAGQAVRFERFRW